jgi:hypothetical protein
MPTEALTAGQLRRELNARAESWARAHSLLHDLSPGASPAVVFGVDADGLHGNFHPASYARIAANPEWVRRLSKPHTASRRSRARKDWRWMELDSATSSDALLMNVLCHPNVFDSTHLAAPVAALLGVDRTAQPRFGANPGVPLAAPLKPRSKRAAPLDAFDRTEIDLILSGPTTTLFVEAKLTESDFQSATPALLARYRDLETVFDLTRLPRKLTADKAPVPQPSRSELSDRPTLRVPHSSRSDEWDSDLPAATEPDVPDSFLQTATPRTERIAGYQLIRNVLAAYAADAAFCVILDARRRDLIDAWYAVLSAVHSLTLATRLRVLTWQDLAATVPADLQHFLATKYSIAAR